MMRTQDGFAHILLVTCLPFILGSFITVYVAAGFTQLNAKISSDCRREQIKTQEQVREMLKKLFAKNLEARRLRTQLLATQAMLLANPSNPAALAQLQRITLQRQSLDFYQKSLLTAAKLLMHKSSIKTYTRMNRESREASAPLIPLMKIEAFVSPPPLPKVAAVPEYPDTAPPYKTTSQFSEQQALVQKWHYVARVNSRLEGFLKGSPRFEKLCSTTLEGDTNRWIITTKVDKF